jgi:hypothetical protein
MPNGHAAPDLGQSPQDEEESFDEGDGDELGDDGEDPTEPATADVAERTKKVLTKLQVCSAGSLSLSLALSLSLCLSLSLPAYACVCEREGACRRRGGPQSSGHT